MKILVADDDRMLSQLVCSIVREAGHTPIAALPQQVKSLGADEYLSKPIDPEVLVLAIHRALREAENAR